MNNDLKSLLSPSEWLVEELVFDLDKLTANETVFTTGNGYLGTRGSLEEGHSAGLPGTYINGLFDHFDSFIVDLVNAPNWSELSVWVEDEKLSHHTCEILDYYRVLDLKRGFLYRSTRFKDRNGRITKYESIRYANFFERHICEITALITPENYSGKIRIDGPINGNVFNLDLEPSYKKKPKFIPEVKWDKWTKSKHLSQVDSGKLASGLFLEMKTLDRPHHVFYGSKLRVNNTESDVRHEFDHEKVCESLEIAAQQGKTYQIEKLVSIFTSRDIDKSKLKSESETVLQRNLDKSFEERFTQHQRIWEQKWNDCDITIHGDKKAQHAIRFNIYHLLITANEKDHKANIGAKSLSGEGYKGHIFWDTEIFLLPFYIYTQPETAKALLMYRYHTMPGAREYALETGYKGTRFPWESADTGHETTPPWTADGQERIWTGEREIHISSAVVFGVLSYFNVTGDIDFLAKYGIEILFETARFWDSRLEFNKSKDRYELTEVEGPDEFHDLVDNSVYTNWLTKWNLEQSATFYYELKKTHPKIIEKHIDSLKLTDTEVEEWRRKASKIYIPFDSKKKLVEQFEGYFDLKEVPITEWDENNMPKYPLHYDHFTCSETTLLKQPDVLMLMYMLPDEFSNEVKRINYEYYEARTLHKSSLSPSIHTIMGIETDHFEKAFQYFERSAFVDLIDNQGNTEWGMHIASCGGTWQAVVNGFAGLRIKNKQLTFKPWLPPGWKAISFKIRWQGDPINILINHKEIQFEWNSQSGNGLILKVNHNEVNLLPDKSTTVSYK